MGTRKILSTMTTRKILSACLAVLLTPLAAQAQFNVFMPENYAKPDTIGNLQLRVQYETRFYLDTVKQEKPLEETMILEVGSGVSKFYSYSKYICDSVYNADIANKASQETINRHLNQYGNALMTEIICKGFPAGQVITQTQWQAAPDPLRREAGVPPLGADRRDRHAAGHGLPEGEMRLQGKTLDRMVHR